MAGIAALLKALAKVTWRGARSVASVQENNFFLIGAVLLLQAGPFVRVLLVAMLLIPLSADPMRTVPPERWNLLPLERGRIVWLRIAAMWLNPVLLAAIAAAWFLKQPGLGLKLAAFFVAAQLAAPWMEAAVARTPSLDLTRWVPAFPGAMGALVRKNLREMISVLDFWAAAALSGLAFAYKLAASWPEPEMAMVMSIFVVLAALGTYAQCLFGLDGESGRARYLLMPLPAWRILLAKDIAFLVVAVALTLPLAPSAGLASALAALAVGHHLSVLRPVAQLRWRFTSGSLSAAMFQAVACSAAGVSVYRDSALWLIPCFAAWALSLGWYSLVWNSAWTSESFNARW